MKSLQQKVDAIDFSERARNDVQALLDNEHISLRPKLDQNAVSKEIRKQRLLKAESDRVQSRVLFVTSNVSVVSAESNERQQLRQLREVFDEVHILVVGNFPEHYKTSERLDANVWLYTASSRFISWRADAAVEIASQQLAFGKGFRPDLIVALDPFESGVAAMKIAQKFSRPWQVQVTNSDFLYVDDFEKAQKGNEWRLPTAYKVLKTATSIRVSSDRLLQDISASITSISDISILPKYYAISHLAQLPKPTETLFPQFNFTVLYIGDLSSKSTFYQAIDAVRLFLQTPKVGLAVIGTGSSKQHFIERATLYGIEKQLLFLGQIDDQSTYMQSADVLIMTDNDSDSDMIVLKAAAVGLPIIATKNQLREELFTTGEDAFLIEQNNVEGLKKALQTFVNTNAKRTQFSHNAKQVVQNRIEEDPLLYRIAYRSSIEKILYAESASIARADSAAMITQAHNAAIRHSKSLSTIDGVEMKVPEP